MTKPNVIKSDFCITIEKSDVFLTIRPKEQQKGAVDEKTIIDALAEQNIENYSTDLIKKAIEDADGKAIKIAEIPQSEPEIQVQISRDRLQATLVIDMPENCRAVTLEEVMDKIRMVGISYGLNESMVQKAIKAPGVMFNIAEAKEPVPGKNAKIKLLITNEDKGKPVVLANGTADYKNLNMFTIVKEGVVLAEKTPATSGDPGIDVLGRPLPPKPGKDMPLPLGKNVHSPDGLKVVATIDGQLVYMNGKIGVEQVIEVKEDVDLSTGNIDFVGNVIVRGTVQQGFTVKAEGNVEVLGSISGGTVEGNNVIVKHGIQGMHTGHIKAKNNVVAKFIENATVMAGQDVIVSDGILHSKVNAGKQVVVEGHRGLIAGGSILAGEEISAKIVGTHLSSSTDLGVGVNPLLREEYSTLKKEIKKCEQSLDQTKKGVHLLKSIDHSMLTPQKREMLLKLTKAQFQLAGQFEKMGKRIGEIELTLEEIKYGKIKVSDTVYPGVRISIGTLIKPIRETLKHVTFYGEEGEVKVGSFK